MSKNLPPIGTKCIVITEDDEVHIGVRTEHAVRFRKKDDIVPTDFCHASTGAPIPNATHWRFMPQKFDALVVEISPK